MELFVCRLRNGSTRRALWYVVGADPAHKLTQNATSLMGWGPFKTQIDAIAAHTRLLAGKPAVPTAHFPAASAV